MRKIVSELNGPHMLLMKLAKHKHKEDLTESTGVVPARDLSKVKLEGESLQL